MAIKLYLKIQFQDYFLDWMIQAQELNIYRTKIIMLFPIFIEFNYKVYYQFNIDFIFKDITFNKYIVNNSLSIINIFFYIFYIVFLISSISTLQYVFFEIR